jgi:nucleoside-triphosphatase THEP1
MSGNIVLWTGPQHSGKTTAARRLVREATSRGRSVAGIIAPSIWQDGVLTGFDLIDLATNQREPLARRDQPGCETTGKFGFAAEGLELGRRALASGAAMAADLVLVDEFGPLELKGGGWRDDVDRLARQASGVLVLVVRSGLTEDVGNLYDVPAHHIVSAADAPSAIDAVLDLLGETS